MILNNASNIYLGATAISAVYLGSQQIWPYTPPAHNYANDYLTTTALESGTISFYVSSYLSSEYTISYSLDNGATWSQLTNSTSTPTLSAGDKVLWRRSNPSWPGTFRSTCKYDVEGNVMSILYGDNFIGQTTIYSPFSDGATLTELFSTGTSYKSVVNAENLVLPATTLTMSCYANMFGGCTDLITAPALPATNLTEMCYMGMFNFCTSLETAPTLPATTLASNCYNSMFSYCTSLETAPALPATTLASGCYQEMFDACSSLNTITCLATDISASNCTKYWTRGVANSGTFIKDSNMSSWTTGNDGIPSGWTIQTA